MWYPLGVCNAHETSAEGKNHQKSLKIWKSSQMSGNHQNWFPKVGIGCVTPVTCDTIREPWGSSACPKPRHKSLVSDFGPTPLPALCFASAEPHLVRTTVPCRHIIQCALNHATKAQFQVSAQPPSPALHFVSAQPPQHLNHLIHTTAPPPSATLHLYFWQHARNWAPVAQFQVLST